MFMSYANLIFCALLLNVTSVFFGEEIFLSITRMIDFKISAPGRIVLCGERAAMYGEHVIVASLDRRTSLQFCELNDDSEIIKIRFPDVDLSLDVHLEQVLSFLSTTNIFELNSYHIHIRLLRIVQYWITVNGMWRTYEQKFSLQTFFFLLYYIAYYEQLDIKSFHLYLSTELPLGDGLGSSSSFAVCLAACFMHWARLQRGFHNNFNEQELSKISMYAMFCEEVIQNYELKADDYVCTYGKVVRYGYRGNYVKAINVPSMKILLVDSQISQNKGELAEQMAELKHSSPELADFILNRINNITEIISATLRGIIEGHKSHNLSQLEELYVTLQIAIQLNQTLLYDQNLLHPSLNNICLTAQQYGFAGKLTGLGSRFVYILLLPNIPEEQITNLCVYLMTEGFNITMTSVSCTGVRIDD